MGKFGKNDWRAGTLNSEGAYMQTVEDAIFAASFGDIPGFSRITAVGNNPDIDAGVPEDIWSGGGLYPWMTAATSLEVVSSNAADTAAGTGARTMRIVGLDANYVEIEAVVTLNGITPVAVTPQFFRINRCDLLTAGTGTINAGTITVRDAGAGATRALIDAGFGITRQSQFTVPAGKTLAVLTYVQSVTNPTATRDVTLTTFARLASGVTRLAVEVSINGNPLIYNLPSPTILPEKTDFGIRCVFASTTNIGVSAGYAGLLRTN